MLNTRVAGRYAKSLIDLAQERDELEAVYNDMLYILAVCKSNKDFVAVLRSPVIKADKKDAILGAVTKGKISVLTTTFNKLLVSKGREIHLPEIAAALVEQYNLIKGINVVKLTTAVPASDELKKSILAKLKAEAGFDNVELETAVNEKLIGGFVLEYDNKLVDASILRDLKDIKKQFQQNVYVHNIR